MTTDSFFHPALDLKTLQNLEIARQLMAEHPAYFAESPYPGVAESLMRSWFGKPLATQQENSTTPAPSLEDDKWEYLYNETNGLYTDLKAAGKKHDPDDAMAYYRTATSLLEKMVSLQERSLGLKQISEHNGLIMRIMESVLSPTQRNEVMDQLKEALK